MIWIAGFFLLTSGIASLTYQVTWVRLLGLSMGSTSASISTVLAAFFMGLALGSYFAERMTRNRIHDLRVYIYLEALIGLSGIVLLPILLNLDSIVALIPGIGTSLIVKFILTIVLLIIPTLCMGATFPVMASILIRRQSEVGMRMSQLYSLNTAGAVLGAGLSGFVLIPNWGLDGSIYIAFCLNMIIVISGLYFNKSMVLPPLDIPVNVTSKATQSNAQGRNAPFRKYALVVLFFTGFVSIATEVGWTKYLALFAGTTIYGFAAILTIFLIGIATGSWAIRSYVERIRRPELWLAFGLVALAASLFITRGGLSLIPYIYPAINHLPAPDVVIHGVKYGFVFFLLFLPTFLFGALFPLNLKLYCGNLTGVRARIGKAYAINTFASIFGSIVAGFWIIPIFGTDFLLTTMATLILLLPLLFVRRGQFVISVLRVPFAVVLVFLVSLQIPHLDFKKLVSSVGYDDRSFKGETPEFLFLKEGKAGVISMISYDGTHASLQNNGLNESFIDLKDPYNVLIAEAMLGLMPYFLHPQPKSAFIVGFGGGITATSLTYTTLESIQIVELEPAVVDAGRAIVEEEEIPILLDPRVRIDFNDARNTLLVDNRSYDIIVAQPSHPWRAGAANVFTKEFFEIVRSRLKPGGISGQWINLFNMDVTTLKALINSYLSVFPEVISFANLHSGDLLLFGSNDKLIFDFDRVEKRMKLPGINNVLQNDDINDPNGLLFYFALSKNELIHAAQDGQLNLDTNILSEVRLSTLVKSPTGDEDPYAFLRKHYGLDVSSYFKQEEVVSRLYDLGKYLLQQDDVKSAHKAANQLKIWDERAARSLEYEILWAVFEYEKALDIYAMSDSWFDQVHVKHINMICETDNCRDAETYLNRILEPKLRRETLAYVNYMRGEWESLQSRIPLSDEEYKWQLLGIAKQNIREAGAQLLGLKLDLSQDINVLNTLVRYYAFINEEESMRKSMIKSSKLIGDKTDKLQSYLQDAIEKNQFRRAEVILGRLKKLNPELDKLQKLALQIDGMRKL